MRNIFWLFDFKITDRWNRLWQDEWGGGIKLIGLDRSKRRIINWMKGAWMALRVSEKNDIIFSWFDFQAVICFVFSKLTLQKRQIVAINVMCKFNDSLKGRVYKLLYKLALSSKDFHATVTSKKYGNYLNKMLGVNREYELIHDANLDKYQIKNKERINLIHNSVFMGGTSSRDWDFAFDLAANMQDVIFNFVMTDAMFEKYKKRILNNTNVFHSIPLEEFNSLAVASSIIIMPSNTEAPAGLMLMFLAAANSKFYITNYTATSCEYITNERGCILPKDVDIWTKSIRYFLSHPNEANIKAENLRKYIEEECSIKQFVSGMKRICDKIENS